MFPMGPRLRSGCDGRERGGRLKVKSLGEEVAGNEDGEGTNPRRAD
jgi:hypothetical protein